MHFFQVKLLQIYILEPYFLTKPLLEPKWDHHTAASKLFSSNFRWRRGSPKQPKINKNRYQNSMFFWECLLEGLLKGLGCQIEAKTIQNDTKKLSKIDKSRPPKNETFYNRNIQEKSMEMSSSNKNMENVETRKC